MLADALPFLRCPVCGAGLALAGGAVRCEAGHSFDVARQGYVSLGTAPGDTAAMVAAREAFLGAGHYEPIAGVLASSAAAGVAGDGCVVEVGAGTAWYLARVLDAVGESRAGIALDSSKAALRRAARAHPRIGAVGCDAWGELPLRSGGAACALCVFAPRGGAELARVLAPGGVLLVVTPTARHLQELVGPLGLLAVDERKEERLERALGPWFRGDGAAACEYAMSLGHADVAALAAMGPSAHHTDADALADAVAGLPEPVAVTASGRVSRFRPLD
jgi:23S rRNA (guanine745-N1)-methyltransferase